MKGKDYSYALGVRVRTKEGMRGEPVGEFGWDGAAGAYCLIDMDNRISIHYVQHVLDPYSWCTGLHDETAGGASPSPAANDRALSRTAGQREELTWTF